jgi:putative endonuclease
METFTTYILYSHEHKQIYIGHTSHLIQRFYSHNEKSKKGWTIRYRPWIVVYVEIFDKKKEANQRELQLKQANWRRFIWLAIEEQYANHGFITLK